MNGWQAIACATVLVAAGASAQGPVRGAHSSPEAQLAAAERTERSARTLSSNVQRWLGEARRARDTLQTRCLDEQLTQVNATVRTLQQRHAQLREASSDRDPSRRRHLATVIATLAEHLRSLESHARACRGDLPGRAHRGGTEVITIIDPETPRDAL